MMLHYILSRRLPAVGYAALLSGALGGDSRLWSAVLVPRRGLRTPPGGFEDPLPPSFGRFASDKGKGGPLSSVNSRRLRRAWRLQRQRRKKLLIPGEATNKGEHSNAATSHRKDERAEDSTLDAAPAGEDEEGAVYREKVKLSHYGVSPGATVFGSELDRLEEDYLREHGQWHPEEREERAAVLPSSRGAAQSRNSAEREEEGRVRVFAAYGGGRKGGVMRWEPSSSFEHLDGNDAAGVNGEGASSLGRHRLDMSAAEERQQAKRSSKLTVGMPTNRNLSAHYMTAREEEVKWVSQQQQERDVSLSTSSFSSYLSLKKSEEEEEEESRPAEENPHFPVSSRTAEEYAHHFNESNANNETAGTRSSSDAGECSTLIPSLIRLDYSRRFPSSLQREHGTETRYYGGSTENSTSLCSPSGMFNAYNTRPWEESLPLLRDANYWDGNPAHRQQIDDEMRKSEQLFRREQLLEGSVDTGEVGYSAQKLRKEIFLYFQAHPINEMITEPFVRLREIYPPPIVGRSERAEEPLRHDSEAAGYPVEWLERHQVRSEAVLLGGASQNAVGDEMSASRESSAMGCSDITTNATSLSQPAHTHTSGSVSPLAVGQGSQHNDLLRRAVDALYAGADVPVAVARQLASGLGYDLIRTGSIHTSQSDRHVIATCTLGDHREHLRHMLKFKLQKLGVQPPPTVRCVEVGFKGGSHPHAIRVKARGIAKRLLHRHVVRVQLTKFGTPREGFAVLQTILDEVYQQCHSVHAYHTAGRVQSNYNEIYCFLYPSTGKSPKMSIKHPSVDEVRAARDLRIAAQEKEVYFDDYHDITSAKERLQYAKKLAQGTAWSHKDDGLSLQRQRAIKVRLGYLPKGNKEMYAARGDVNIPAPFRTSHPTGVDRWTYPVSDNLEQAGRGAAVLGKRAAMPISVMHDAGETESNPSTLDRFYYRVQGSALEVGELKEALGLKDNRKKVPPLAPGFATLGGPSSESPSPSLVK